MIAIAAPHLLGRVHAYGFRIADTFTGSLARLPGQDQKAVKTTAFDLQVNPAQPGLQFHRIEQGQGPELLVGAGQPRHSSDRAQDRAEHAALLRRPSRQGLCVGRAAADRLTHPRTGAAQLVEIRERVEQMSVYADVTGADASTARPPLFAHQRRRRPYLLVRRTRGLARGPCGRSTRTRLFQLAEHLPQEAAEALLDLAVGAKPKRAQRCCRHMRTPSSIPTRSAASGSWPTRTSCAQALEYPWERWTIFLHPAQRQLVERHFGGPARVAGSAGTGKTVVALHRAAYLARRDPEARVLVTTFSRRLALALEIKLRRLLDQDPGALARVTVAHVDGIGYRLHELFFRTKPNVASAAQIENALTGAAKELGEERFSRFLLAE